MKPTEQVKQVLQTWLEAVNSGDLKTLKAIYSHDAVLLPTFSNHSLNSVESREAYFTKLASREGLSVELHPATLQMQHLSQGLYSATGMYCWKFDVDGELLAFEARFTFIIDVGSAHPILHQHSSQAPQAL